MNGKPTLDELLEVQDYFGLPSPGLVEKDWHVVRALAAIAAVDTGEFRLVFGGGTAFEPRLQAYETNVRRRRSQDRLQDEPLSGRAAKIAERPYERVAGRWLRIRSEQREASGVDVQGAVHEIHASYKPLAQGKGLRPDVQIETSVWPLRRDAVDKPVISFVAEAYGREPELPKIACSSILETAAEKLVALTWRAGSELAGLRQERDPTLMRHIYDLHMTRAQYDAAEAAALAHEVMKADAQTRGDRFPAWQKNPLGETLRAIEGIPKDKVPCPLRAPRSLLPLLFSTRGWRHK